MRLPIFGMRYSKVACNQKSFLNGDFKNLIPGKNLEPVVGLEPTKTALQTVALCILATLAFEDYASLLSLANPDSYTRYWNADAVRFGSARIPASPLLSKRCNLSWKLDYRI